MKNILLSLSLLACINSVSGQAGSPDVSFGNNGVMLTDFGANVNVSGNDCRKILVKNDGSFYLIINLYQRTYVTHRKPDGSPDSAYGINGYSSLLTMYPTTAVLQPDGKIVLAGSGFLSGAADFVLARLNINGMLDSSFSEDGIVTTNFIEPSGGDGYEEVYAVALQPDGKIIAGGSSHHHFALARYHSNGTLDAGFSGDGLLRMDFGTWRSAALAITIQNDNRIVVAGSSMTNNIPSILVTRFLENGIPDVSFSTDGLETFSVAVIGSAQAVKLQTDGKIVLAGSFYSGNNIQMGIARLLSDGTLDNSFSEDGIQIADFSPKLSNGADLLIQPNGKIVIAGAVFAPGSKADFGVARFNPDGSVDNTFSGDGKIITPIGNSSQVKSVGMRSDGILLVAGSAYITNEVFAVAAYTPDGTLDNSFDGDGILTGYRPSTNTTFISSAVQSDGKIVVVGNASIKAQWPDIFETEIVVVRYNTDGTPDYSFSDDGKLIIDYGTGAGYGQSVAIQQDGKIVIGGYVNNGSNDDFAVIRLNHDGSLDNSFSGDGKLLTDFGNSLDQCLDIGIQADGKIIAVGFTVDYSVQHMQDIAMVRYNTDGSLDNSFSDDGKVITDFTYEIGGYVSSTTNTANTVLIQPDGRIVITGQHALWTALVDFMVVRYMPDGTLDPSFNGSGMVITDIGGMTDQPSSAILQANGKIVVTGLGYGNSTTFAAVRYNSNGTLDNSFSNDGILTESIYAHPWAVVVQPDGKLIFGGSGNSDAFLFRYNSDGTPDNSFSTDGRVFLDLDGIERINSLSISGNRLYAAGEKGSFGNIGFVAAYHLDCSLNVSIPYARALPAGVETNTVYIGYSAASSITLSTQATQATANKTYLWSTGETTATISVSPVVGTSYTVTITDGNGCTGTAAKIISVKDIRCGANLEKVLVCHKNNGNPSQSKSNCISASAVPAFLANGSYLGSCREEVVIQSPAMNDVVEKITSDERVAVYPNPTTSQFTVVARSSDYEKITVDIYDASVRVIERKLINPNQPVVFGAAYRPGIYFAVFKQGNFQARAKLVKQ